MDICGVCCTPLVQSSMYVLRAHKLLIYRCQLHGNSRACTSHACLLDIHCHCLAGWHAGLHTTSAPQNTLAWLQLAITDINQFSQPALNSCHKSKRAAYSTASHHDDALMSNCHKVITPAPSTLPARPDDEKYPQTGNTHHSSAARPQQQEPTRKATRKPQVAHLKLYCSSWWW
jgi:hypothetical protein